MEELFEKLWKLYPNKKGKSAVSTKAKKELEKAGEETVTKAIYNQEYAALEILAGRLDIF